MSRFIALLLAAALAAGGLPCAAPAQTAPPSELPRRGPEALWDEFPLEQRPPAADAAGEAAAAPQVRAEADRIAFLGQEPADGAPILIATGLCVVSGILLCAVGLWLARGRRWKSADGRGRSGLRGIRW